MTACHFANHIVAHSFFGSEPSEVDSLLAGLALTCHGNHIRQTDCVMSRIIKSGDGRVLEVLDHSEGSWLWRNTGQGERAKIFLKVSHQCIADAFVQHHPARYDHSADASVCGLAQQHSDMGDFTVRVHPHGHRIDIDDGNLVANLCDVLRRQPRILSICFLVAHLCDITMSTALWRETQPTFTNRWRRTSFP